MIFQDLGIIIQVSEIQSSQQLTVGGAMDGQMTTIDPGGLVSPRLVELAIRSLGLDGPFESETALREKILEVERVVLSYPQTAMPIQHQFFDGFYVRTIFIPAGTILTGKTHRKRALNVVKQGRLSIRTVKGWANFGAGAIFQSDAGSKKLGIALQDCIFSTIHETEKKDFDGLEEEIVIREENNDLCQFDFITGEVRQPKGGAE